MNDLLLDSNQELDVQNGDFVTGESTLQNQDLLIMTNPGEWKEDPTIAVGIAGFLKDYDLSGLLGKIKEQFQKDGMQVKSVSIIDGKIVTNANY